MPTVTTGSLAGTDTGAFTQTFDTANVGIAKTLTPAGLVSDGNGGANYAITFANDTSGVISARAVTVSATTDTKTYDSTTSSAAIPTVTSGSLVGTDTGSFTQTFDTDNVGTAKTLTPGRDDHRRQRRRELRHHLRQRHHRCHQRPCRHGDRDDRHQDLRRARPARRRSRPSPAGRSSAPTPVRSPRRSTPPTWAPPRRSPRPGRSRDGNGGANYAITFANDTTGVISQWAVTVTADSGQAKIYGTPDPTLTYTVTSGSLQPGDSFSGALARTAGENVGITAINQGTLTAGPNYTLTFVPADFTIVARAITVTAASDTKVYDSTTSSSAVPTVTTGSLAGTDTGAFTQTFDTANVGTAKTLTPAGLVSDGNGGANYAITFANDTSGVISARAVTVSATTDTKTYDSTTSSAAIPTVTSGSLVGTDTGSFTQTFDTANVGTAKTLTPAGTIT